MGRTSKVLLLVRKAHSTSAKLLSLRIN